jgi:hypothetical protein
MRDRKKWNNKAVKIFDRIYMIVRILTSFPFYPVRILRYVIGRNHEKI